MDASVRTALLRSQVIDLNGRTVVPGLNDSHLHLIRGGLNYNLELRWEGVPSVADALRYEVMNRASGRSANIALNSSCSIVSSATLRASCSNATLSDASATSSPLGPKVPAR